MKMIKKIVATIMLSTGLVVGGASNNVKEFNYEYRIVLNSNSIKDVLDGYTYKEHLIDQYNELINYLDPSLHQDAVINNINKFAREGSSARYEDGRIVVYVGNANGDALKGELKKNACDTSNVRVKFYFSKYFFSK
jgi:hypothetical protein